MSDDWEALDSKPAIKVLPKTAVDRWDGEDEDDVKDNWDDEEEEEDQNNGKVAAQPRNKKRSLQQIIQEKEEKQRKEAEERKKRKEEEDKKATPEQQSIEKLRLQKLQEESDLKTAMETCGISTTKSIDSLTPVDKNDYDNLRRLLVAKLSPNEKSPLYVQFLEDLMRDLTTSMGIDDIRRIGSTVTSVANEKLKMAKTTKGKKKKGTSLKVERGDAEVFDDYDNQYDDFM